MPEAAGPVVPLQTSVAAMQGAAGPVQNDGAGPAAATEMDMTRSVAAAEGCAGQAASPPRNSSANAAAPSSLEEEGVLTVSPRRRPIAWPRVCQQPLPISGPCNSPS
jgi:hypothetical protein